MRWLEGGFGVALGWLWGRNAVPINRLWCGLGVALGWLCTPEYMPSICLLYGFAVTLGGFGSQDTFACELALTLSHAPFCPPDPPKHKDVVVRAKADGCS